MIVERHFVTRDGVLKGRGISGTAAALEAGQMEEMTVRKTRNPGSRPGMTVVI